MRVIFQVIGVAALSLGYIGCAKSAEEKVLSPIVTEKSTEGLQQLFVSEKGQALSNEFLVVDPSSDYFAAEYLVRPQTDIAVEITTQNLVAEGCRIVPTATYNLVDYGEDEKTSTLISVTPNSTFLMRAKRRYGVFPILSQVGSCKRVKLYFVVTKK